MSTTTSSQERKPLKRVYRERLLKLATFLETVPRKKFDFSRVVGDAEDSWAIPTEAPRKTFDCGSVACAIGWCPVVFPRLARYRLNQQALFRVTTADDGMYFTDVARELFAITSSEAYALFSAGSQELFDLPRLSDTATPKQVARNIRTFVKRHSK
jgi:hypothetical protein